MSAADGNEAPDENKARAPLTQRNRTADLVAGGFVLIVVGGFVGYYAGGLVGDWMTPEDEYLRDLNVWGWSALGTVLGAIMLPLAALVWRELRTSRRDRRGA